MSFLTTIPEELTAAAAQLGALGSSLAAQNAGAAASTTAIAPAAADQVSILQSGIFTSYGTLYQQIAAEAQAIHEQFVNTLGLSSGTYASTEAANSAANTPQSLFEQLVAFLGGNGTGQLSGGPSTIGIDEIGNFTSGYSDLWGMAGGGLFSALPTEAADATGAVGAADAVSATGPAGAGMGAMPLGAGAGMGMGMGAGTGMGQATMVGKLSVPPSWAGTVTTVSSTTPIGLQTAGWTAAAPQAAPGTIVPGMAGMGGAARNGAGFGAPRYGVKPLVMPKSVSV
jgi:hypothetical protein